MEFKHYRDIVGSDQKLMVKIKFSSYAHKEYVYSNGREMIVGYYLVVAPVKLKYGGEATSQGTGCIKLLLSSDEYSESTMKTLYGEVTEKVIRGMKARCTIKYNEK